MIIGIDPGAKGALCLLRKDMIFQYYIFKAKTYAERVAEMNKIFLELPICPVVFEDVHSIFGMSAKSNFTFGKTIGIQYALCVLRFSKVIEVPPKEWQKFVITKDDKIGSKNTKETAFKAAKRLFPYHDFVPKGCKVPHDGLVDSVLIAYYGLFNILE